MHSNREITFLTLLGKAKVLGVIMRKLFTVTSPFLDLELEFMIDKFK